MVGEERQGIPVVLPRNGRLRRRRCRWSLLFVDVDVVVLQFFLSIRDGRQVLVVLVRSHRPVDLGVPRRRVSRWKESQVLALRRTRDDVAPCASQHDNGVAAGIVVVRGNHSRHAEAAVNPALLVRFDDVEAFPSFGLLLQLLLQLLLRMLLRMLLLRCQFRFRFWRCRGSRALRNILPGLEKRQFVKEVLGRVFFASRLLPATHQAKVVIIRRRVSVWIGIVVLEDGVCVLGGAGAGACAVIVIVLSGLRLRLRLRLNHQDSLFLHRLFVPLVIGHGNKFGTGRSFLVPW
mmetsp:Transcript_19857/g.46315  ORF Transcript_19857/g.46315 Transcript_19857/m.46315 type:complete len:291 (+) Transcript_19857:279-1151(+)